MSITSLRCLIALGMVLTGCKSSHVQPDASAGTVSPAAAEGRQEDGATRSKTDSRIHSDDAASEDSRTRVLRALTGASIVSDEDQPKFLGTLTSKYDLDSVFNRFGTYGTDSAATRSGTSTATTVASTRAAAPSTSTRARRR